MGYKSYKFRMFPTDEQADLMWKTIGCARFVYNQILADRNLYHELYIDGVLSKDERDVLQLKSTPAFYKGLDKDDAQEYYDIESFEFLKSVDSLALANAQMNAGVAYKNFFLHGSGERRKTLACKTVEVKIVYNRLCKKQIDMLHNMFLESKWFQTVDKNYYTVIYYMLITI